MASVTLNGVTYTDDSNASTGFGAGGHRVRFVPCLQNFLAEVAIQLALINTAKTGADTAASNANTYKLAAQAAQAGAESAKAGADAAKAGADAAVVAAAALASDLLNNPSYSGTSTTSLAVGDGTKTLTIQSGKSFYPGMTLTVFASISSYMIGTCTAYNSGTGSITIEVSADKVTGSGTYNSWTIGVATADGAAGDASLYYSMIFA